MPYTSADLERLQHALTSGELRVRFADGREVEYRSVAELQKAIGLIAPSIAANAGRKRIRRVRVDMDSGLR